jgi:DNA mismatch endonuclease (patch repair protein)
MADVHSKETRSYNMSKIKGKNTKPEMIVRKFLHSNGLRYKLHPPNIPGKPDLVFPKFKTVIFVHGCFWHGHDSCRYYVIPKSRTEFWTNKINSNKLRDTKVEGELSSLGWRILTVWECQLKPKVRDQFLKELLEKLLQKDTENEIQ